MLVVLTLSVAVMFPQIIRGSYIAFAGRDLYTFYDLCGRLFPLMGALNDQHLGGLIVWIPASMMSSARSYSACVGVNCVLTASI